MSSSNESLPADQPAFRLANDGSTLRTRFIAASRTCRRRSGPCRCSLGPPQETATGGSASAVEHTVEQLRAHATELADRLQKRARRGRPPRESNWPRTRPISTPSSATHKPGSKNSRQELDDRAKQLESQDATSPSAKRRSTPGPTELTHVRAQTLAEQEDPPARRASRAGAPRSGTRGTARGAGSRPAELDRAARAARRT